MAKEHTSLKKLVYNSVSSSIIKGEYKPGDIINEQNLMTRFNVSKSPVREALAVLCKEKYLRALPRLGYQVVSLTSRDINEISQFRILIECGVLNAYKDHINDAFILGLKDSLDVPYHGENLSDSVWAANIGFHLKLISICENFLITETLKDMLRSQRLAYSQFYCNNPPKNQNRDSLERHKKIVSALEKGDLNLACEFLREDILYFPSK